MQTTLGNLKPIENLKEVFQNCSERAPMYDRENRFFTEDFEELKDSGYLLMALPEEFGGYGMSLAETMQKTRELAYHAAPTALGLNMHNYWIGLIADLWRQGDNSLNWLLEEAGNGKVFAAGHAESGNDVPVLYSTTKAEKVDGGYVFTGHKSFGSLTPVWNYLGIHGQDNSDPSSPKVVHAFMPRETEGYEIKETWDNVLGMRATRSDDTVLNGVFVPDRYIARVVPTGFAGVDGFVLGIFAWALLGFGNIYYALAQRVFDMVAERLKKKKSIALDRPSMAYHPGIQHDVAEMVLELEGIGPHLDTIAHEWSEGKDYGAAWGVKIVAAKCHAVESAWKVVDKALDIAGGFGIFPASGLERMIRDARLGRIHPSNTYLTREILAKGMLGLDPDEQPR
ncbi:MAG: acyl-CoA/acyl-ACP dehydrogenase [Cyclobacteriaceae bacterium]|nr:acyl-CoA/acyl-ACP dehydrogenase [Cyclobacteriaceae bacterium]